VSGELFPSLARPRAGQAVEVGGESLTWEELASAVASTANDLRAWERIALWAEPSLETVVTAIAGLAAGATVIPLSPGSGSREVEHILADSKPDVMVCREPIATSVASGLPTFVPDLRRGGGDLPSPPPDESIGLILYTSGTTGLPKGVMLSRRAITSNVDALAEIWQWTSSDVLVHALPLFHVHGLVLGTIGPVRLGSRFVHAGAFSPEGITAALASHKGTMLFGVPTMYHRISNALEEDPALSAPYTDARLVVSGSAALPAIEHRRFSALTGQQIVERYGMTETIMNVSVRADGERVPGYVGLPVPGVDVRLVDDGGHPIDTHDDVTIGEVQISGPNLFSGYLNNSNATAAAMSDGWFKTGDLATRRQDGYIRLIGRRATDLIKTGGFRVGAGEVEGALLEHPAVAEAAVLGRPDADLGERIEAWVVLRPEASATEEELVAHVATLLSAHKRPRDVRVVDALPRNAMGKVLKSALRDRTDTDVRSTP
jgi:malonyl-CoA/methylmalonyl-CoA synthetase